jgi:hypothetical protein
MTAQGNSRMDGDPAVEKAHGVSLADVIERVGELRHLSLGRRRRLQSGVRTVCKVLRANPRFVPAEPRNLRIRLAAVAPAATGRSRGTWTNARSLTLSAIRLAGVRAMAGSTREPLAFP